MPFYINTRTKESFNSKNVYVFCMKIYLYNERKQKKFKVPWLKININNETTRGYLHRQQSS